MAILRRQGGADLEGDIRPAGGGEDLRPDSVDHRAAGIAERGDHRRRLVETTGGRQQDRQPSTRKRQGLAELDSSPEVTDGAAGVPLELRDCPLHPWHLRPTRPFRAGHGEQISGLRE